MSVTRNTPRDIEAEMASLGSVILSPNVIEDMELNAEHFYTTKHGVILDAMKWLKAKGTPIDIVPLRTRLEETKQLHEIGGVDYLIMLAESVPTASSAIHYAEIVKEKYRRRCIIGLGEKIVNDAYDKVELTAEEIVNQILSDTMAMVVNANKGNTQTARALVSQVVDELIRAKETGLPAGISTGFFDLDDMTGGIRPGEYWIIAGRPSMGKTILATGICENVADAGVPSQILSVEMSDKSLAMRLLAGRANVENHRIRDPRLLTADEFDRMEAVRADALLDQLIISDVPGLTIETMFSTIRRAVMKHKVQVVALDYLQLMTSPQADTREQEVAKLSKACKTIARQCNVAMLVVSQLSRKSESRENKRPMMSDLRDSGSLEQDADVILTVHREDYYHRQDPPEKYTATGIAEIGIIKARNAATGDVSVIFDSTHQRFRNMERQNAW